MASSMMTDKPNCLNCQWFSIGPSSGVTICSNVYSDVRGPAAEHHPVNYNPADIERCDGFAQKEA